MDIWTYGLINGLVWNINLGDANYGQCQVWGGVLVYANCDIVMEWVVKSDRLMIDMNVIFKL